MLQGLPSSSSDWQGTPTADCNTPPQQDPAMLEDPETCDSLFASLSEDDWARVFACASNSGAIAFRT